MLRITLAVLHLLALGIAVGAIFARARILNRADGDDALRRAFAADNWWGISALLFISTGLWRAFGGLEKAPSYYWNNHVFWMKMGLLVTVFALEIWPATTLIRWRMAGPRGQLPDMAKLVATGKRIARISDVQLLLLVGMIVAAATMARGYGLR